jgi:ligand-binding sensor domain-containing protein
MDSEAVEVSTLSERSKTLFHCISLGGGAADSVNVLVEDSSERIWIGTDRGLYRLDPRTPGGAEAGPQPIILRDPSDDTRSVGVSALVAGDAGEMWVGTGRGLIRILANGRALPYPVDAAAPAPAVRDIARGVDGRLWVAYPRGLLRLRAGVGADAALRETGMKADSLNGDSRQWVDLVDGEVGESALLVSTDGRAWVGTDRGLLEFDGRRFRRYQTAHGLPERLILELADDRDQTLWIASLSGVIKLSPHGFITYDEQDGLKPRRIHALFEDASGGLARDQHEVTGFTTQANLQNLHPRFKSGRRLQNP